MKDDLLREAECVYETVRAAAADALQAGRAELTLTTARERYGETPDDFPVVMLSPMASDAAPVVVEVQRADLWWLLTADGPGTEFYVGMEGDRHRRLRILVEAVIAGRYVHGPAALDARAAREVVDAGGWIETFETGEGEISSRHFGRDPPPEPRRFAPY